MATNDVYLRPDAGDGTNGVRLRTDAADSGGAVAYTLVCAAGAYVYTGVAANLVVGRNLPLETGAYVYTGQAATLAYVPGAAKVDYVLACDAGAYVYSGNAATLTYVDNSVAVASPVIYPGVKRKPIRVRRKDFSTQENYEIALRMSMVGAGLYAVPSETPQVSFIKPQKIKLIPPVEDDTDLMHAFIVAIESEWSL